MHHECMPKAIGKVWRHCRAQMDITSDQAAGLLGIKGGALRQIETSTKPASLALAYRASRLYGVPVNELIVDEDAPTEPEPEPKPEKATPKIDRVAPPPRRNGSTDRRGPRRAAGVAA